MSCTVPQKPDLEATRESKGHRHHLGAFLLFVCFAWCAGATPPTTPWRVLEGRAGAEGVDAVREILHREVAETLDRVREPVAGDLEEALARRMALVWTFEHLSSWAKVEARALRREEISLEDARVATAPLFDLFLQTLTVDAQVRADREHWLRKADRRDRERLGLTSSPDASIDHDRSVMTYYVALLAKLCGDSRLLQRVVNAPGAHLAGFEDQEAFSNHEHDYDAALQILSPPKPPARRPVSSEEEQSIRRLVADFWDAVIQQDVTRLGALFVEANVTRELSRALQSRRLAGCSLDAAHFNVQRLGPSSFCVRVYGVSATVLEKGRPVSVTIGKTFQVEKHAGQFLIRQLGELR